jgi:hypothetical protein
MHGFKIFFLCWVMGGVMRVLGDAGAAASKADWLALKFSERAKVQEHKRFAKATVRAWSSGESDFGEQSREPSQPFHDGSAGPQALGAVPLVCNAGQAGKKHQGR